MRRSAATVDDVPAMAFCCSAVRSNLAGDFGAKATRSSAPSSAFRANSSKRRQGLSPFSAGPQGRGTRSGASSRKPRRGRRLDPDDGEARSAGIEHFTARAMRFLAERRNPLEI